MRSPLGLIFIGFILVFMGFLLPLLMMIRVIEPGLALSFISYMASMGGLLLGVIGVSLYTR